MTFTRREFDAAEVELIGRMARDGALIAEIMATTGRCRSSVQQVLRRLGIKAKKSPYYRVAPTFKFDARPATYVQHRKTQAPKPLPPEQRIRDGINYAGHARWLRW